MKFIKKLSSQSYIKEKSAVMSEDFDVIKWREENPMDYQKAMDIINNCPDAQQKNIFFRTIYKATRLHIPDILYKFFSLNNNKQSNTTKFETLRQQQIFMSNIKDLNDPFDNKAYYYDPQKLSYIELLAPYGGKLIDDFSAFVKISALTANDYSSMPMWAHYANNHNGFCISYDMNLRTNMELRSLTFPVQYTDKRIDVSGFMEQQAQYIVSEIEKQNGQGIIIDDLAMIFMTSFFCNIKHKTWAYENEFRCTTGATAKDISYISAVPKEIYVGLNCTDEHINTIVEISNGLNIPVHRTVFNDLSPTFSLSIEQI